MFNKLHDEILMFTEGVKSIMEEVEPIKNLIIQKVSEFIYSSIPGSSLEVYGSHATKLCLHWSDVDLVFVPPPKYSGSMAQDGGSQMNSQGESQLNHNSQEFSN